MTDLAPVRLTIALPQAYDASRMLAFFTPRAIKGVEHASDAGYRRTFVANGVSGAVQVEAGPTQLAVTVRHRRGGESLAQERVARLFNVSPVSAAAVRVFNKDPVLSKTFGRHRNLRVPGCWDPFELGVRAILGQQVSVAGATTLAGRIAAGYGKPVKDAGDLKVLFPEAEALAQAKLDGLGLTTRRAATITGFARAVCDAPSLLDTSKPLEQFVSDLVALDGFGPWTAHYMAMRLGYPDAFPASDLGVRKALNMAPEKEVRKIAENWRPYRATAVMLLWQSLG